MPALFISYRRGDSPDTVKLIHERLIKRLPRWEIFYDHDSIPLGDQFPERLKEKVASATAVLVIIGPKWPEILGERKSAPIDHVRVEVKLALESGTSVVPVLAARAAMPSEADLADFADLQPLLERNGRPVRPDPDFDSDLEPIVTHLKQLDAGASIGTILADKYTLTEEIGVGGMGVVYLAKQKQPVQRNVAIKLIKPGMDSRDVLARFDAERQALAVMDHPNIAKVHDAGLAASGRPFFVMEYVKGVPITQYCDDKKLTPQERLNLLTRLESHASRGAGRGGKRAAKFSREGSIMSDARPETVLQRLTAPVADYTSGQFQLRDDLDRLARVHRVAAPEAVVFYGARILEVLAADALRKVWLEPGNNLFGNLDTLLQYNLIAIPTLYWAHALRRVGNQVRHLLGRVTLDDAERSLLFTERCLYWFFHDFRHGEKKDLTRDGQPLGLCGQAKVCKLVADLEALDQQFDSVMAHVEAGPEDELWQTSALPAVLAEMCLNRRKLDEAHKVLRIARATFSGDLRLDQLWGLYSSRTGEYRQALAILEPLYKKNQEDEETAGIIAGVYKRCWQEDQDRTEYLKKAQGIYGRGWKKSHRTNAYLGINAAATALWLGRRDDSHQLAVEVRKKLHDRMAVLSQHLRDGPEVGLNYWEQATLAEAEFLLGNLAESRRLYNQAFELHAQDQAGSIKGTRAQLEENLRHAGLASSADAFLKAGSAD